MRISYKDLVEQVARLEKANENLRQTISHLDSQFEEAKDLAEKSIKAHEKSKMTFDREYSKLSQRKDALEFSLVLMQNLCKNVSAQFDELKAEHDKCDKLALAVS